MPPPGGGREAGEEDQGLGTNWLPERGGLIASACPGVHTANKSDHPMAANRQNFRRRRQAQTAPSPTETTQNLAGEHSAKFLSIQGPSCYVRGRPENTALGLAAKPPRRTHRRSYDVATGPPFDGASAGVGRHGPRSAAQKRQNEDISSDGGDGSTAAGNNEP